MRKERILSKIFGVALVFVMIEMMPWYDLCKFEVKTIWM